MGRQSSELKYKLKSEDCLLSLVSCCLLTLFACSFNDGRGRPQVAVTVIGQRHVGRYIKKQELMGAGMNSYQIARNVPLTESAALVENGDQANLLTASVIFWSGKEQRERRKPARRKMSLY